MNFKIVAVFCILFALSLVKADDFNDKMEDKYDSKVENSAQSDVTDTKKIESEITDLAQQDSEKLKKSKGFCHWGVGVWYKPGFQIRCRCMKCTCRGRGIWDCKYNFAYCPYYYCGNQIFNPEKQLCCCGKVYARKSYYRCCGYFYYDSRISKCCKHDTVKPRKVACPRFKL